VALMPSSSLLLMRMYSEVGILFISQVIHAYCETNTFGSEVGTAAQRRATRPRPSVGSRPVP
jgi:hypothetical protein